MINTRNITLRYYSPFDFQEYHTKSQLTYRQFCEIDVLFKKYEILKKFFINSYYKDWELILTIESTMMLDIRRVISIEPINKKDEQKILIAIAS